MSKTQPSAMAPVIIGRIGAKRFSRKYSPTPNNSPINSRRIQQTIHEIFKRYDYEPIDMEALIFFTLQRFEVSAHTYENMYKVVRQYVMDNLDTMPGKHLLLQEVNMRRMIVSCSNTE